VDPTSKRILDRGGIPTPWLVMPEPVVGLKTKALYKDVRTTLDESMGGRLCPEK